MAPRSAKAKKATDVKVAENEAPKKGRGKAKNTEEVEQELPEVDIDEKPAAEKKTKRGKKAQETNGEVQTNGTSEESVPPAKRGRKKKEPEESANEKATNGDHSADEEAAFTEDAQEDAEQPESNGTEETQTAVTAKGRKKPVKKEGKPKESGRGKKKQASPENDEEKVEEKPKGKGRGRKAKAEATPEPEEEEKTEPAEEAKPEPVAKGRKKAAPKAAKEKTPESEKQESADESEKLEAPEEEKVQEQKKEVKGRKGKKAQAKEEGDETEEKEPASKKRKVNKKEDKAKGDMKEEEAMSEGETESQEVSKAPAPAKGRGARAKKAEVDADEEPQDAADSATTRKRKPAEEKAPAEDSKKKAPPKNKATTNYEEIDFSNNSKSSQGKDWNFKIASWNVDGIRAWLGKGGLDYIKYEKPDILCLQETKCAQGKLPEELTNVPGYHAYWLGSDKEGYAGVGIYTTRLAINVQYGLQNPKFDDEGRIITAEYEQFYLICTYVPNAGRKLVTLPKRLEWNEEFRKHVKELDKKKPVIICGDMNVSHNEIDLANPKANRKNAGFTDEERAGMTQLLGDGFVDTFRHFYPDKTGAYTFWTFMSNSRSRNVGWRLDYFIVSERLLPSVCDNVIRDQVYGSDHCPLALFLHLTSADKPKEE